MAAYWSRPAFVLLFWNTKMGRLREVSWNVRPKHVWGNPELTEIWRMLVLKQQLHFPSKLNKTLTILWLTIFAQTTQNGLRIIFACRKSRFNNVCVKWRNTALRNWGWDEYTKSILSVLRYDAVLYERSCPSWGICYCFHHHIFTLKMDAVGPFETLIHM
jgi:hypothetical protein